VERASPPRWRHCVEAVADETAGLPTSVVLVAHSGSGPLLPAIADGIASEVAGLIFVDAGLPARAPSTPLAPPAMLARLRRRAVDGVLPPWSTWFGADAMRELLPDDSERAAVERELPSLPLEYFEEAAPTAAGWDRVPCGYVRLSEAYEEAAADAEARGWPVEAIDDGHHLSTCTAPERVAEAVLRVWRAATAAAERARP
jgi:hypothetical protein